MRIILADDQPKVRLALRMLLEQEPGMCVVAEASSSDRLLAEVKTCRPNLVLLDWGLGDSSPRPMLPTHRELQPALAVIVLSGEPWAEEAALDAGADAFVSKADPPEKLLAAVRAIG